jgi:hypothetical protein
MLGDHARSESRGARATFQCLVELPKLGADYSNGGAWLAPLDGKWKRQNAGKTYSLTTVREPNFRGRDSLRFEIRQGDQWEKTFRSEVSTGEFAPMGSTRWYKFSILLPKNFPIENNRLVLAQWWAKTKTHLGEVNRSPILHLRFGDGVLTILLRRYPNRITRNDESYIQNNLYLSREFPLGSWNTFVFQVRWQPDEFGFIHAWLNGVQIIDYRGITENQDEVGPVFKFGLYRDDSSRTYVGYYSDVAMGLSEFAH